MGIFRQIAEYLYIRKRDKNETRSTSLKFMHGVNRLSILLFILAMIILAIKLIF